MKTKQTLVTTLLLLLLDTLATGLFAAIIFHLLAIQDIPNSINATPESILFGPSFLLLLSPVYMLATPILGHCSDVFGRKRLLAITIGCDCAGYTLCLLSIYTNSMVLLVLGLMLLGIGNSNLCLSLAIAADIALGKAKSLIFALMAIVANTVVVTISFSNQILAKFHYSLTCYKLLLLVIILIEVVDLILIAKLLPETNTRMAHNAQFSVERIFRGVALLLGKNQIRFFILIFVLIEFAAGLYNQYIFTYLTTVLHTTIQSATLFINYRTLIMLLSLIILYPLITYRWSIKHILAFCLLLSCVGLLGATLLPSITAQWVFCALIVSGFAMLQPTLWVLLSNGASRYHQGLMLGLIMPAWILAWVASGTIGSNNSFKPPIPLEVAFSTLAIAIIALYYKLITQK